MLAVNLGWLVHPHFLHRIVKNPFKVARLQLYQTHFFLPLLIYFLYHSWHMSKKKSGHVRTHKLFLPHPIIFLLNTVNSALGVINNIINDTCLKTSLLSYLFYCHEERTVVYSYILPKSKEFSNNQTKLGRFCSLGKSHVFPEK